MSMLYILEGYYINTETSVAPLYLYTKTCPQGVWKEGDVYIQQGQAAQICSVNPSWNAPRLGNRKSLTLSHIQEYVSLQYKKGKGLI